MSLPPTIAPAILDTILGHLALLFLTGAGGDLTVARHAASQMLAAYKVETPDELRLAAEIISFSLYALEALSQAAAPDLSLNRILRLRGGAVSLSREGHKSQRTLDQLQRARRVGAQQQPANGHTEIPFPGTEPIKDRPRIDKALDFIHAEREPASAVARTVGQSWSQSFQKRATARRITENLKKSQANHASHATQIAHSGLSVG